MARSALPLLCAIRLGPPAVSALRVALTLQQRALAAGCSYTRHSQAGVCFCVYRTQRCRATAVSVDSAAAPPSGGPDWACVVCCLRLYRLTGLHAMGEANTVISRHIPSCELAAHTGAYCLAAYFCFIKTAHAYSWAGLPTVTRPQFLLPTPWA